MHIVLRMTFPRRQYTCAYANKDGRVSVTARSPRSDNMFNHETRRTSMRGKSAIAYTTRDTVSKLAPAHPSQHTPRIHGTSTRSGKDFSKALQ
mmetsp:Transcript_21018/g.32992  ORF Transcript_21018/g.32992 Transcript_21018/m.32992 type:complete len:93 (-) Transcript_21018:145-423(-)